MTQELDYAGNGRTALTVAVILCLFAALLFFGLYIFSIVASLSAKQHVELGFAVVGLLMVAGLFYTYKTRYHYRYG